MRARTEWNDEVEATMSTQGVRPATHATVGVPSGSKSAGLRHTGASSVFCCCCVCVGGSGRVSTAIEKGRRKTGLEYIYGCIHKQKWI